LSNEIAPSAVYIGNGDDWLSVAGIAPGARPVP
jgi:hypothetical protein